MKTIHDSEAVILQRKQQIFELKIAQEEHAISQGGMAAGNPIGYKTFLGQSRESRLEEWHAILAQIKQQLALQASH